MKRQFLSVILLLFVTMTPILASRSGSLFPLGNKQSSQSAAVEKPSGSVTARQAHKITGKVSDSSGQPMPGVSILVKGTSTGSFTDTYGNYTIEVPNGDAVLIFSFIGYLQEQKTVGTQTTIDVAMIEDIMQLEEVVVVGYGVQKKSDVTGALINVSAKELTSRPVNNAFEAMQGKAAGVDIVSNERPGELGTILIRGQRSLGATNSPLYVVDGIPLASGGFESINPHDIESIDILKDASATAIYGSRGANGVILVTTKSGKNGAFKLNYTGTVTMENIVDKAPSMNASDYITWKRWAYYNSNTATATTKYAPGNAPTLANDQLIFTNALDDNVTRDNVLGGWADGTWDGSKVKNTDWTKFVTKTGITQEHTLSASGGTDKMSSYVSFGYLNNEGTQRGQSYSRYNAKLSVNITPKKWFNIGGSMAASWALQDYGFSTSGQSSSSGPNSLYSAAKSIPNIAQPYNANGDIILYPGGISTIYTIMNEWDKSIDKRQTFRLLGSFFAGIDFGKMLPVLEGLKYHVNFGPDYSNFRGGLYVDKTSAARLGSTSLATWKVERHYNWTLDNILTYDKSVGKHKFGVTLLQSASATNEEKGSMTEVNVPKPSYLWNGMGAVDITSAASKAGMSTDLTETQLTSYMGRLTYAYNERYLLTVSGRSDGSSVLAAGHKWALFSSAALGWRIDKENFMQDQSIFNQLKLRLGYGTTGNSAVSAYQTLGSIQSFYVPFDGSSNQLAYATNEPYYTSTQVGLANPLLGWETTAQYNLGVDFSILKGRIGGTIDVYQSHTTDLLMTAAIPTLSGYPNMLSNVGESKNKGIDITLNLIPVKTTNFSWNLNINAAYQQDAIVNLMNGKQDMVDNAWFIGKSINAFYGLKSNGLWQTSDQAEMDKFNVNGHTFQAGMVKPVDQNGDYKIDANDRIILGNAQPKWTLGLNNSFEYKNFELSCMIYGRFGYMISTGGEGQGGINQQRQIDYWTPENPNAKWQKPIYSQSGGDPYSGLLGYRDASYLKVRNISLGYNLSTKACKTIGIENLKIYAQAKNLGTLYSTVDWIDLDLSTYTPSTKTSNNTSATNRGWVVGVEIGF